MLAALLIAAMFLVWARDDLGQALVVLSTAIPVAALAWMEATWRAGKGLE